MGFVAGCSSSQERGKRVEQRSLTLLIFWRTPTRSRTAIRSDKESPAEAGLLPYYEILKPSGGDAGRKEPQWTIHNSQS